ncbi:MAG: ABC transporter permease subunit [Betaproteobacteria bacterium]|nr:ABC transporter permease subunit [Betaproteobacteria bacterium]
MPLRALWLVCLLAVSGVALAGDTLVVGSKRFTESYILGEIITQTAEAAGTPAEHRQGMGNTAIVFEAIKAGSIDVYPDYTGTIARQLLGIEATDLETLNRHLEPYGLAAGVKFGFQNTYALALLDSVAERLHITKVSDLVHHPELRVGLGHEFLERNDGWPGLRKAYGLPQRPEGLDHGLAYEAIAAHQIDVMDIYSTDAKIARYHLRVLEDDRHYFPEYDAVMVYRRDLPARFPEAWAALRRLRGAISAKQMIRMNAEAELDGRTFRAVAAGFLGKSQEVLAGRGGFLDKLFGPDTWRLTREHLFLVFGSLLGAVLLGVPLGVWATRNVAVGQVILSVVGIAQTIPSLALLALLIPLLGMIGTIPAIVALFLYSLLPIVRNTHAGLTGIAPNLLESARALGLPTRARLRLVELPLAAGSILAGIKTSAVINVGTATIAAFVGAGGYGERIVTGLALNDHELLLGGAIPAAALALIVQWSFDGLERLIVPAGLRKGGSS